MSIREVKKNYIVDVAAELYLSRGIVSVTVKDVAEAAGVGEATLYRYFSGKKNLVVAVAEKLAKKIHEDRFDLSEEKTGFEKLTAFFMRFLHVFNQEPELYRFVSAFDAFVLGEGVDLTDYERSLFDFFADFSSAYEEGIVDGTVAKVKDLEVFYLTATHSLLGLCKKLTAGKILRQDKYGAEEVETLISVILQSLKARV